MSDSKAALPPRPFPEQHCWCKSHLLYLKHKDWSLEKEVQLCFKRLHISLPTFALTSEALGNALSVICYRFLHHYPISKKDTLVSCGIFSGQIISKGAKPSYQISLPSEMGDKAHQKPPHISRIKSGRLQAVFFTFKICDSVCEKMVWKSPAVSAVSFYLSTVSGVSALTP